MTNEPYSLYTTSMTNTKTQAKVVMVKKNPCPYCDRAKTFFEARDIKFDIIDLTDKPDELAAWKSKTGWATVPIILINDKLIGGYTDIKALDDEGKLNEILYT